MPFPPFNEKGDLPTGIHQASLAEVIRHFGVGSAQPQLVGRRLERIYKLAQTTRQVVRFVVFGSFVTSKPEPGNVDIFMLMDDSFDVGQVQGEAAIIFDHMAAQNVEGASIFWIRRMAAIGGEQSTLEHWQIKRDKTRRGIV